jgi:hypothetical protein
MEYEELMDRVEELEKYAEVEGTEVGELCQALCVIAGYPSYMSDEFLEAVTKEICSQLDNFKKNTEWVTEERTEKILYRDLVWK